MSAMNISTEFSNACRAVRQRHLDHVKSLGISATTITEHALRFRAMGFGVTCGTIGEDGLYIPGDGPSMIVLPIVEEGGLVDLVAWRTAQPGRWGLRTGLRWALGADNLCAFGQWSDCIALHDNPLGWLRAGCDGGCVVDWDAPEVEKLAGWSKIETSRRVANILRPRLARPRPIPEIVSMEAQNAE